MPGIESLGETAEKVVPLVRFPVLMRVFLPGAVAATIIYPFTGLTADVFNVKTLAELEAHGLSLLLVAGIVFVSGALISAVNGITYKIFEGRMLWPSRLLDAWIARQQARVERLRTKADMPPSANIRVENQRRESWDELRTYPMNDNNEYYASSATRLGNILTGYEQYPLSRYGMSGIFYFPRLWMAMKKEIKEDIDSGWSIADGFLSLSATSMLGGATWLLCAMLNALDVPIRIPFGSPQYTAIAGCGWIALGYGFYRLSLPFHRQNGDTFKSMFDLYRDKIWKITKLESGEDEAWRTAWLYFQYKRLICPNCKQEDQKPGQPCPNCGHPIPAFR
jgi:hypothetical protein